MKLTIRRRILSALTGLLLIVCAAFAFLLLIGCEPIGNVIDKVRAGLPLWQKLIGFAGCAVLVLLGLQSITMLFSRKEKGVVMQQTEYGDMSISMNAIRSMVTKVVDSQMHLKADVTDIHHLRNGISIGLKVVVPGGTSIPLTVSALQKQLKQYISSCSGIEVEEVRILVETDVSETEQKKLMGGSVAVPADEIPQVTPEAVLVPSPEDDEKTETGETIPGENNAENEPEKGETVHE